MSEFNGRQRETVFQYPEVATNRPPTTPVPPQLPDESADAYKAFCLWVHSRGRATQEWLAVEAGVSRGYVSTLARRYSWRARVEALGADGAEFADRQTRIKNFLEMEYQRHKELTRLADEAIEKWRESDRLPTLAEIGKLVELASRIGRLSLGLPLDGTEMAVEPDPRARAHLDVHAALLKAYGSDQGEDDSPTLPLQEEPTNGGPADPALPVNQEGPVQDTQDLPHNSPNPTA